MSAEAEIDKSVLGILSAINDPEIPVLNIVEMGIVRSAVVREEGVLVRITPTYSGCPAMHAITTEIAVRLRAAGYSPVEVATVFDEVWTTDWMTDESREKLRKYGIAPPDRRFPTTAMCPRCGSAETKLQSYFGSTPCKALYFCPGCSEPFEAFKCI